MVAQRFALSHPELVRSLTLVATLCTFKDPVGEALRERARVARTHGMETIAQLSNARWFPPEFKGRRPDVLDRATTSLLSQHPNFHGSMWDMISALDFESDISAITCPTLVVVGAEVLNAPLAAGQKNCRFDGGASLQQVKALGHFPPIEQPRAFRLAAASSG